LPEKPHFSPTRLAVALIIVLVPALLAATGPQENQQVLVIECGPARITVDASSVENLTYTWIHSVEGTPISETYEIEAGQLVLVEITAESFGAGHPYSAEELGCQGVQVENGTIRYWGCRQSIGSSLEIAGHPDYTGTIVVSLGSERIVCSDFTHAVIRIESSPPRTP